MTAPHTPAAQPQALTGLRQWLRERWPLPETPALADALLDAWSGDDRGYHDLLHLREVLERLEQLAALDRAALDGAALDGAEPGERARLVALAAWFHDAVYDDSPDPEGRSATWAETSLTPLLGRDAAAEVSRLVLLTREHSPDPDDVAGVALCDADLAILAAPPERYADYVAGVRREYASVPDALFATGRSEVLRTFLDRQHVYTSTAGRALWEEAARRNALDELERLSREGSPTASDDADQQP